MGSLSESGEWLFNTAAQGAEAEMIKLYSLLPREAIPRYRVLFSLLSDPDKTPILFHCSAGKDRTGLAAALILHALGADKETIMEDYLASTEYLHPYCEVYSKTKPHKKAYMTVKKEYLLTAFSVLESYGGMDKYLVNELKADIKLLQRLYTENAIDTN
jgi:protein-tyrosine phosphatase